MRNSKRCGNHFKNLFSAAPAQFPRDLNDLVPKLISNEDNLSLCKILDEIEILEAVKNIGACKVPRPDEFSIVFYHKYWSTVKEEVIDVVTIFFFEIGYLLRQLNHSNIVLIPNDDKPCRISNFRSISLCNVSYKLFQKS